MSLLIPNGKPGGITLPDIPEGLLDTYPYAMILSSTLSNTTGYMLIAAETDIGMCKGSVVGSSWAEMIMSLDAGVVYTFNGTVWGNEMLREAGSFAFPLGDTENAVVTVIWSNTDIYEVTSFDASTGKVTVSGVYFPEQQTIAGIELPKIPEGFETSYPYRAVISAKMIYSEEMKQYGMEDIEMFVIFMSPNPLVFASDSSAGTTHLGCIEQYCYNTIVENGKWGSIVEDWDMMDMDMTEIIDEYMSVTFSIIYSNHNIMDATVNADGSITTLNTVYYQGSGAVAPQDTFAINHASLVYMAREARRLSGQTLVPLSMEDTLTIITDMETYEDAEGMVF